MTYGKLNQKQRDYLAAVIDAVNRQDVTPLEGFHPEGLAESLCNIYTVLLDPMPTTVMGCHNRMQQNLHYNRAQYANSK